MAPVVAPLEVHIVRAEKYDFEAREPISKWDRYRAMKSAPAVPTPDDVLTPSLPRSLHLCELGDAAWEIDGSL